MTTILASPTTALRRCRWRHLLYGALLLAVAGVAYADDGRGPAEPHNDGTSVNADESKEPRCVHGCERWGKVCNVDPRGVYKCRRVCEKFGEICE